MVFPTGNSSNQIFFLPGVRPNRFSLTESSVNQVFITGSSSNEVFVPESSTNQGCSALGSDQSDSFLLRVCPTGFFCLEARPIRFFRTPKLSQFGIFGVGRPERHVFLTPRALAIRLFGIESSAKDVYFHLQSLASEMFPVVKRRGAAKFLTKY